jgi:tubulin-specific chaperone A
LNSEKATPPCAFHEYLKTTIVFICSVVSALAHFRTATDNSKQTAIEETRAVFPPLRQRIADAVQKLEDQVEAGRATDEEITKAKEAIEKAKEATKEEKK